MGSITCEAATVPPLQKTATAAKPTNPAIQGIVISKIAPVDNPLLLLFLGKISV